TLPSIKLRKCSSKIITSILSFISGRLATKSNQIKQLIRNRSEERRVGKECRSRWSAYHEKKKTEGPAKIIFRRSNINDETVGVMCLITDATSAKYLRLYVSDFAFVAFDVHAAVASDIAEREY